MSEKYRPIAFFNGVSSFKAAFPGLADALIEWRERSGAADQSNGDLRKTGFRRGNFTQGVLPCSNPTCRDGGYEVDRLIADMLQQGQTEREGTLLCSGREMGDEVRRGPVRCPHRIQYRITLSPRPEESGEDRAERGERRRYNNRRGRSTGRGRRPTRAA